MNIISGPISRTCYLNFDIKFLCYNFCPCQIRDELQSFVTVRVPLYVSYLYHAPDTRAGWTHFDHKANMDMTFVYDTAVVWQYGIGAPEGTQLKGEYIVEFTPIEQTG